MWFMGEWCIHTLKAVILVYGVARYKRTLSIEVFFLFLFGISILLVQLENEIGHHCDLGLKKTVDITFQFTSATPGKTSLY